MNVDLNDLVVFTEVVGCGSFTAAGKKLGLPPSAVSRRVARLEQRLGFKLLHRTTRSLGLTDSGRIYYERTARIAHDVEEAARAVNALRSTPSGLLRVTAPPDDGGVIWALLHGFIHDHPEVDIELLHTLKNLDLVEEGIDVALRGGPPPDTTLFTAHKLIESRIILAASPEYLARRGTPKTPRDLEQHDCVALDNWAPNAVSSLQGEGGPVRVVVRNRVRVNRLDTARNAALEGLGIAPLLELTCTQDIRAGTLVEVLPGTLGGPAPFWAIYPTGRPQSAAARALVDHLVKAAGEL